LKTAKHGLSDILSIGHVAVGRVKGIVTIMKSIVRIVLLTAFATAAIAGGALASDSKWGAFAVDTSDKTKEPYYGVGGGNTEKEASDYAMKFCNEEGGKDCALAMTYEQCGALASDGKSIGWGKAPTKKKAEEQSIQGCDGDGCKIVASDCN
jgi:hypothetical protein